MAYQPIFNRSRIGNFKAHRGHGLTQVVGGTNAYVMEDDFNEMQNLISDMNADTIRQTTSSGVLDFIKDYVNSLPLTSGTRQSGEVSFTPPGLQVGQILNRFDVGAFNTYINGYKSKIAAANNTNDINIINTLTPPTYGMRDDLHFLEYWFEEIPVGSPIYKYGGVDSGIIETFDFDSRISPQAETTRRIQLQWKLRSIAGVDFNKYSEGLGIIGIDGSTDMNIVVTAQASFATPIVNDTTNTPIVAFYSAANRLQSAISGKIFATNDNGLYIAGTGDDTSKTILGTADGYSYAIPLFRVKRRNNGGYNKSNKNGARDYQILSTINTLSAIVGGIYTIPITGSTIGLRSGDILSTIFNPIPTCVVVSVNSTTSLTIKALTASISAGTQLGLKSDRPDGLYSNIIDISDVVDLRHKTTQNGISAVQLAEQAIGEISSGNLFTKDTKTLFKEKWGLRRISQIESQQLQYITIKNTDGTFSDLTNLFGQDGSPIDTSKFAGVGTTLTFEPNIKKTGIGSLKIKRTSAALTGGARILASTLPTTNNKYYILVSEIRNESFPTSGWTAFGCSITDGVNNTVFGNNIQSSVNNFGLSYCKFASIGTSMVIYPFFYSTATDIITNYNAYLDNSRLYEIDQATYNLIDIDPSFTGATNIGLRFPYTESIVNFSENFIPTFIDPGWTLHAVSTIDHQTQVSMILTGASQTNTSPTFGVSSNTQYSLSGVLPDSFSSINIFFLDSAGAAISNFSVTSVFSAPTLCKTVITSPSNAYSAYITFFSTNSSGTIVFNSIMLSKIVAGLNYPTPFVPFGRWEIPLDYTGLNLGFNIPTYHHGAVNAFNGQRKIISDAISVHPVSDVIEVFQNAIPHIKTVQSNSPFWTSGDTIKIHSDNGVITGPDYTIGKVIAGGVNITIINAIPVISTLNVGDTFKVWSLLTNSISAQVTITAADSTAKTITISSPLTVAVGDILVKITQPIVEYTPQINKLAQAGSTSTTINFASDASIVNNFYNNMSVRIISGTGKNQTRVITSYNGSTLVATVAAWITIPDITSVYSIILTGSFTNLGTKDATFTLTNTIPSTADGVLLSNSLNTVMQYNVIYQNAKGIQNIPSITNGVDDIFSASVNTDTLNSANTISLKANFVGRTNSNTDYSNHLFYSNASATLNIPSFYVALDATTAQYSNISVLDGNYDILSTTTNGFVAQNFLQFDLIKMIENKYGQIPADGIANKILWIENNYLAITVVFNGYATSVGGSTNITMGFWCPSAGNFSSALIGGNSTSSTFIGSSTSKSLTGTQLKNAIDTNGMIYMLIHCSVATNGITAAVLNTDYIEIQMSLNDIENGYNTLRPDNPFPSLISNLLMHNQATPKDTSGFTSLSGAVLTTDLTQSKFGQGCIQVVTPNVVAGEGASVIIPITIKDVYSGSLYLKGNGTLNVFIRITHSDASFVDGTITSVTLSNAWQRVIALPIYPTNGLIVSSVQIMFRTASTHLYTFYVDGLKIQRGAADQRWTEGRRKNYTTNFLNKIKSSVSECPHKIYTIASTIFDNPYTTIPSQVTEITQNQYDTINKLDGTTYTSSVQTNGLYQQVIIEFDLSFLGMSLTELKLAWRQPSFTYKAFATGNNAGVSTAGLVGKIWNSQNAVWESPGSTWNIAASAITLTMATGPNTNGYQAYITKDQKVYIMLTSQYSASATISSSVIIDYVKMDAQMADYVDFVKSNIVKVYPETKEIKLFFPPKQQKLIGSGYNEDNIILDYQYIPYQGIGSNGVSDANGLPAKALTDFISLYTEFGTTSQSLVFLAGNTYPFRPVTQNFPSILPDGYYSPDLIQPPSNGLYYQILKRLSVIHDAGKGQTVLIPGPNVPITGKRIQNINASSNLLPVRGIISGILALDKPVMSSNISSSGMVIMAALVSFNNEAHLFIQTFSLDTLLNGNTDFSFKDSCDYAKDLFKISGRPLLKNI